MSFSGIQDRNVLFWDSLETVNHTPINKLNIEKDNSQINGLNCNKSSRVAPNQWFEL